MDFKSYAKMDNVSQKTVDYVDGLYLGKDTAWVALEKVDGSNFAIYINGDGTQFARRKDILKEDESFNNWQAYKEAMEEKARGIYKDLQFENPDCEVRIYGELCGGNLEGYESQVGQIRKNVQYSPNHEFFVFDIVVNDVYLSHADTAYLALSHGFKMVPVVGQGSFEYVLSIPNDQQSLIPSSMGYKSPADNKMEGLILKPLHKTFYNPRGNRIILKSKWERTEKRKEKLVVTKMSMGEKAIFDGFCELLTEDRLESVLSKELDVKQGDFGDILKLLISDAKEDYFLQCGQAGQGRMMSDFYSYPKMIGNAFKYAKPIVRNHWIETFSGDLANES